MNHSVNTSATVGEIQAAIVAAQAAGLMAVATRENSALSSGQRKAMYADLTDVILSIQPKLAAQGLGYMQFPGITRFLGEGDMATLVSAVTTRIIHKSGEFIECEGEFIVRPPNRPLNWSQAQGLAQGYAKRQSLMAALGIPSGNEKDAEELSGALGAGKDPAPQYAAHWSDLIKGKWDQELVEGFTIPLGEMSTEEKRVLIQKKAHHASAALTAFLWDSANSIMDEIGMVYEDAGSAFPSDPFDMPNAQVGAFFTFAKSAQLRIEAEKRGEAVP